MPPPSLESPSTSRALPPAASTTAISGGFLPNSGSSTTSRVLPPAVSTTAISNGFSNSFTSGGLLPNSGSSTTSTAILRAYPHFPPHVYQSHQKMPWHNSNPFVIVPINNRIKKCADAHLSFWTPVVLPLLVWLFAIVKRTST